ncbi:MAG: PQQ-binding-like beta-propeller repeat protein, partial [Candidatus Promineifilaceae bacterium]
MSHKNRLFPALLGTLLLSLLLFGAPKQTQAQQTASSAYWRYDAPGRFNNLTVADLNMDGIDEFVVVAGDTGVIVVGSDGRAQWNAPFQAREAITHVTALNAITDSNEPTPKQEIAIATKGQLTLLSSEGERLWERPLDAEPAQILSVKPPDSDLQEILVAQKNGNLVTFNGEGQITWRYQNDNYHPAEEAAPQMQVADLDRNGSEEIIFSYLTDQNFSIVITLQPGATRARWAQSNNGLVTALAVVEFDPTGPLEIAVGTDEAEVYLYTASGNRRWPYRTPNKPVTALAMAQLAEGPALIVGTSVGNVIAYDKDGRRYWSGPYETTSDRPVAAIRPSNVPTPDSRPAAFAIILGHEPGNDEASDVLLIDDRGRRLEPFYPAADPANLTQLVDINHDGNNELLLVSFASMELLDPGIGAREYSEAWDYVLEAEPQVVTIGDILGNGEEELLLGTNDGNLTILKQDGQLLWTADLGGVISQIKIASMGPNETPRIVVVHNNSNLDSDGLESFEGWVEVLLPDNRLVWNVSLPVTISSILVADINRSGTPELVVGTTDGQLIAYSINGDEFWHASVNASVNQILLVEGVRGTELMVSSRANTIDRLNNKGGGFVRAAEFLNDINDIYLIDQEGDLITQMLVSVDDGTLRGVNSRGLQTWELPLDGLPTVSVLAENSVVLATDEEELFRVDFDGNIIWRKAEFGRTTSLYWGDLDGDFQPDVAVGNRDGELYLISGDTADIWGQLNLASNVFYTGAFPGTPDQQAELVAVTTTGKVQLFRSRANRPPLLINPQTEVDRGRYTISVGVIDVENDLVYVLLEVFSPTQGRFIPQEQRQITNGVGTLSWSIDPPENDDSVLYRFRYDDGSHVGEVQPAPGPAAEIPSPFFSGGLIILLAAFAGSVGTVFFIRQSLSPSARVRRFYQKIRQQPALTLISLEEEYTRTSGSPDFLLNLANMARQDNDQVLASLADGLFLLDARPDAALPIIIGALEEAGRLSITWQLLEIWQETYQLGHTLLTAPTITELSLLRPQLVQLLSQREQLNLDPDPLQGLLPILTSARDSERVDQVDDRLVYLNEAGGLLRQLEMTFSGWQPRIENTLTSAITDRWLGLINAGIEELRGRAQLVITLKTKRLVPEAETVVAVEIFN